MTQRHGSLRANPGPLARGAVLAAAALVAGACAGLSDESGGDFGPEPTDDGAFSDAGAAVLDAAAPGAPSERGGLLATPASRFGADSAESDGLIGFGGSCFDATDDDGADDGVDCDDPGCAALRSCCVGDGDCCAPVAPAEAGLPDALDLGACPADPTACAAADVRASFGSPAPVVVDGALRPGGDLSGEGGVVLGAAVDLRRERVAIDVVFAEVGPCPAPCVEAAGVALVDQAAALAGPRAVRPVAGLLLSWGRAEVQLVLGDAVVAAWPAAGVETWTLAVKPDGEVAVERDGAGAPGGVVPFAPAGPAHLVVHGRNASAPGPGAGVVSVAASVALCDVPDAWAETAPLELVGAPAGADAPTLALAGGGDAHLAVAAGGRIHLARRPAGGAPNRFVFDGEDGVGPGGAHDAGGLGDPELVAAGGQLTLFYTAIDGAGRRTIGRADRDADGRFVARPAPVLTPATVGVVGHDRPTVAVSFDGTWVLVVRTERTNGEHRLEAFASVDAGRTFAPADGGALDEASRAAGTTVESASLLVHNGAWQIVVSRRDGARHRVDLLASDDLVLFRVVDRDVLGGEHAFDRLGARAVDVAARPDALEAVYVGVDGVAGTLARAFRPSPSFGVREGL